MDAFVFEDGMSEQGSRRKLVLSGLEANTRYRTNVALFLTPGSTGGVQVDVRVLDSFGRESKKIRLRGPRRLQSVRPAQQLGPLRGSEHGRVVPGDRRHRQRRVAPAYVGAYATVIDNLSEDATFVAGQPAP